VCGDCLPQTRVLHYAEMYRSIRCDAGNEQQKKSLILEIANNTLVFVKNPFGNY
jgi:hypothetical protein